MNLAPSKTLKTLLLLSLATLLSSCKFINWIDSNSEGPDLSGAESLSLIFSGNINGETHPCGCRHFPLGGLPQVAGILHDTAKKNPVLYLDAGDTFFISPKVPESLHSSLTYNAQMLASSLKEMGLSYMVPGDQDLALGTDYLRSLQESSKIEFLLFNLNDQTKLISKPFVSFEHGKQKLFISGYVLPKLFEHNPALFSDPIKSFAPLLAQLKEAGYNPESPTHRLILLSHSGMDFDQEFAKAYPMVDWIIGAHSQSFTKESYEVGTTHLVQVLSRNHYLGEIKLALKGTKKDDRFTLLEVREERAELLENNPWNAKIIEHKKKMSELQDREQKKYFNLTDHSQAKYKTAQSCLECHQDQAHKWQNTPHALAHLTLINAGEQNNLECLQCHTLGTGEPRGFMKASDVVIFEDVKEPAAHEQKLAKYMDEVKKAMGDVESVRALKATRIRELSDKWMALDREFNVSHNFGGVQCLNCHDQPGDHPFDVGSPKISKTARMESMKTKCLNCHDPDQSPEWYHTDTSGKISGPNHEIIDNQIKEIACPAI